MISKKIILLLAIFFPCFAFSEATNSKVIEQLEFNINGVRIGDELKEDFFNSFCPPELKNNDEIECKNKLELEGIKLSILYFFYNSSLVSISIKYPSSKYGEMISLYTKKFSREPHGNKEESILLSTGTEYTNEKSSWKTISGEFVIEKYGNSLKSGIAYLMSDEYEKYKEHKRKEENKGFMERIFSNFIKYFSS